MVLVDTKANPKASWEFLAEIWVYGATDQSERTLPSSYQPVVNTLSSRQTCIIVDELTNLYSHNHAQNNEEEFGSLQLKKTKSKSIDHKMPENNSNGFSFKSSLSVKKISTHKMSCDNLAMLIEKNGHSIHSIDSKTKSVDEKKTVQTKINKNLKKRSKKESVEYDKENPANIKNEIQEKINRNEAINSKPDLETTGKEFKFNSSKSSEQINNPVLPSDLAISNIPSKNATITNNQTISNENFQNNIN